MSCAMRRLRKSPSRWHGGAEGELRAGSGAMRRLRLVYELRICADLHGGVEGELRAGSGAMRWRRLVYELRISRICAEAQRGAAARIHARCGGGDYFFCV